MKRWMAAYSGGLDAKDAERQVREYGTRKYKSHRRVPERVARAQGCSGERIIHALDDRSARHLGLCGRIGVALAVCGRCDVGHGFDRIGRRVDLLSQPRRCDVGARHV